MSGFTGGSIDQGPQATLNIGPSGVTSDLMYILTATDMQPGSPLSYEACKVIYTSHPLGKKMVDAPIDMAQSQEREIAIPGAPEERLLDAFNRTWKEIQADRLIASTARIARIYGISSLAMGVRGEDADKPIARDRLHEVGGDLYFSVFDPLNTAGSLVLNQDPNDPGFQKPVMISVSGKTYHPSNVVVQMNEQPLYIDFTDSAFGFVGRSVYQRSFYPLKSYVQTMITDDLVSYKAGVIVSKMRSPSSNTTGRMAAMFGWKRQQLKTASAGNVLGIGVDDSIESIDLKNLEQPFRLARENILKNIATGADMPARVLDQETLSGNALADGTEDAKQIARWVERFRITLGPLYSFFDDITQRIAWSPAFYADLQRDGLYRGVDYNTAFYQWRNTFDARWPNLLIEPESKRMEAEKIRFESAVALYEVMAPQLDAYHKAMLTQWIADEINARKDLFSADLSIDTDALEKSFEKREAERKEMAMSGDGPGDGAEPKPVPFSSHT